MNDITLDSLSSAGRHAPLLFAVLMGALDASINLFPVAITVAALLAWSSDGRIVAPLEAMARQLAAGRRCTLQWTHR